MFQNIETKKLFARGFIHIMKIGDKVINVGRNSMFYGKIGTVLDMVWGNTIQDIYMVIVEYPNFKARGRHPVEILKPYNELPEDLFTL